MRTLLAVAVGALMGCGPMDATETAAAGQVGQAMEAPDEVTAMERPVATEFPKTVPDALHAPDRPTFENSHIYKVDIRH